jgi:pimeloyl-ACP methyl ester carboxylesterase
MEYKFAEINTVNIFYRQKGKGPFLFLLHPSPRSSKMMVPLIDILCTHFTVIAPDTPGYGYSAALPQKVNALQDYLPYINGLIQFIAPNQPVCIYGTATGAQLAIAYGLSFSQHVKTLFLDNYAHFEEAERKDILQNYFPNFSPQPDGTHLNTIWNYVCDNCLYFPWYNQVEANRIATELPPVAILQEIVRDYIMAGTNYADAYKAAFMQEKKEILLQLTCTTVLFKWLGSPVLKYINRITNENLPANMQLIETPKEITERYSTMQKCFQEFAN